MVLWHGLKAAFLQGSNTVQGLQMTRPAMLKCERVDHLGRKRSTTARVRKTPRERHVALLQSPALSTLRSTQNKDVTQNFP